MQMFFCFLHKQEFLNTHFTYGVHIDCRHSIPIVYHDQIIYKHLALP